MNYLLIEILTCLLIAGIIGAIIGWLLRGGCKKKIRDCEEECRMKINSLESNYNSLDETDDYQKKFESEATKVNQTYQEINDPDQETTSLKSDDLKLDAEDIKLENHFLDSDMFSNNKIETTEPKGFIRPKEKINIPTLGNIAIDDINLDKPLQIQDNRLDIELETPEISKLSLHDINLNRKEEDISIEFKNPDIELKSQKIVEPEIKLDIPDIPDVEKRDDIKLNIPDLSLRIEEEKYPHTGFILGDDIDTEESIPKEESVINKDDMQETYDIQEIEGIGPAYGRKLRAMGVDSTLDLIELFKKNNHRIDRAAQDMRIKPETITAWISMADLMTLPGINSQCAELLQTVGISSAIELSITNAHSIHSEMSKFNKKYPVCPEVPSAETITTWILSAKSL